MNNINIMKAKRYLNRFDEILEEMSNKMLTSKMTNNITINFIRTMLFSQ